MGDCTMLPPLGGAGICAGQNLPGIQAGSRRVSVASGLVALNITILQGFPVLTVVEPPAGCTQIGRTVLVMNSARSQLVNQPQTPLVRATPTAIRVRPPISWMVRV